MSLSSAKLIRPSLISTARYEAGSWAAGLVFTFALFFAMARLENIGGTTSHNPEILDLPMVTIPLEAPPPPPRPIEPPHAEETLPALTGIELENTGNSVAESPVKIVVLPPDLEALVAKQRTQIPALASIGKFATGEKPQIGVEKLDVRHIYQASEVDQRPAAVVRVAPNLWPAVFNWGPAITVILLLRIDTDGRVENASLLQSCGHPDFDAVVVETVKDQWLYTPAIKHGRKVRCLVQQKFTLVVENGSVFSVH